MSDVTRAYRIVHRMELAGVEGDLNTPVPQDIKMALISRPCTPPETLMNTGDVGWRTVLMLSDARAIFGAS